MTTLEALVVDGFDLPFVKRHDLGRLASSDGRNAEQNAGMTGPAPRPAGKRTMLVEDDARALMNRHGASAYFSAHQIAND